MNLNSTKYVGIIQDPIRPITYSIPYRGNIPKKVDYPIFLIIITIAIIIITLVILLLIGSSSKAGSTNQSCNKEKPCQANHYCGGDNLCHPGVEGKHRGEPCTEDRECQVGISCIGNNCM